MNHGDFNDDSVESDEFFGELARTMDVIGALTHERLSGGEMDRRREAIMDRVRGRKPADRPADSTGNVAPAPRTGMGTIKIDTSLWGESSAEPHSAKLPMRLPEDANEGRRRVTARPSKQALALEHEAARIRAKLMDPETALRELAERLTFAHVQAGKPSLGVLSEAVHYSKGTLSKVFAGKMLPSWPLVEDLAVELRVPTQTVVREWFHLWTAANTLRRKPSVVRERATAQPTPGTAVGPESAAATGPGYICRACGSWVVDPALHTEWHRQVGEAGREGPESEAIRGWADSVQPGRTNEVSPRERAVETDTVRDATG